jgi:hypothetical protein
MGSQPVKLYEDCRSLLPFIAIKNFSKSSLSDEEEEPDEESLPKATTASSWRPAMTLIAQAEAMASQAASATTVAFVQSLFEASTFLLQEILVALQTTAAARVLALHMHVFVLE